MSLDNKPVYSGGCQCGAVRFRVEGALSDVSICHCRMCQKASGNFYEPLVSVRGAKLSWTRGAPKTFRSSNFALRGFCAECGTPLTYEHDELPGEIYVHAALFDEADQLVPDRQAYVTSKLFWMHLEEGLEKTESS